MAADVLRRARLVRREIFDPTNESHVESFKVFLVTGSWGDIQFYPEDPYTEAPATVMSKYAMHQLGVARESTDDRQARLAARGIATMPIPLSPSAAAQQAADRLAAANVLMQGLLGSEKQAA